MSFVDKPTEQVDIREFPKNVDKQPLPPREITIGDLHGNALLLLNILLRYGVITLPEASYHDFVEIYQAESEYPFIDITYDKASYESTAVNLSSLQSESIERFNKILNAIEFGENPAPTLIRLIGDELADRGANDYFTLKILEKLTQTPQNKIVLEILLSNHGMFFFHEIKKIPYNLGVNSDQFCSIYRLFALRDNSLVPEDENQQILETSYYPNLKLLSYTLNTEQQPPTIIIHTHALIEFRKISELATYLECAYDDSSIFKLAQTLDRMNKEFQARLSSAPEKLAQDSSNHTHVLFDLIWQRNNFVDEIDEDSWPTKKKHYHIRYCHGHDGKLTETMSWETNLNGKLGKYLGDDNEDQYVGIYPVVVLPYSLGCSNQPHVLDAPSPSSSIAHIKRLFGWRVSNFHESDTETAKTANSKYKQNTYFNKNVLTAGLLYVLGLVILGGLIIGLSFVAPPLVLAVVFAFGSTALAFGARIFYGIKAQQPDGFVPAEPAPMSVSDVTEDHDVSAQKLLQEKNHPPLFIPSEGHSAGTQEGSAVKQESDLTERTDNPTNTF